MAQIKVTGTQLDIQDVANKIADDSTAIGKIASGVTTDPGAVGTLDAEYLRRDGTAQMLVDLDLGANNLITTGNVDGRDVSVDGTAQDGHIADLALHFTEASIIHANLVGVSGTLDHTAIDTHIGDVPLHFTEASILHQNILGAGTLDHAAIDAHIADVTGNPHVVTKAIIGLGNANDTSDADKPVSLAQQTALDLKNDVTAFDAHATDTANPHSTAISNLVDVILTGSPAAINGDILGYNGTDWINIPAPTSGFSDHTLLSNIGLITHDDIDTHIGDTTIHFTEASISHLNILDTGINSHDQIDLHLGNGTALHQSTQIAFAPTATILSLNLRDALIELDTNKANLVSPIFSGVPTTPTGGAGDTTAQIANNAFVLQEISAIPQKTASDITNVPTGSIAAIDVQAAIDELNVEKFDGTFNITVNDGVALQTVPDASTDIYDIIKYGLVAADPLFGDSAIIKLGGTGSVNGGGMGINIDAVLFNPLRMKNDTAIQAYDALYTGTVNLVSRAATDANAPPAQGPAFYDNEIIVGDGGVTTAIRSGTVGTNDPVVRAGVFGATDDWKIWHEGNLTPVAIIADLTDVVLTSSLVGDVLTFDGTDWINQAPTAVPLPLEDLTNVVITGSPAAVNGDVLTFDGIDWINQAPTGGGGAAVLDDLTDVDTTTTAPITSGEVLVYDGAGLFLNRILVAADITDGAATFASAAQGTLANTALQDITTESIGSLSDVTLVGSPAAINGDVLIFNGTDWANATLTAANITNVAAGNIVATDVQTAIDELDTNKTTDTAVAVNHYTKTESDATTPAAGAKVDTVVGVSGNVVEFDASNAIVDSGVATSALAPLSGAAFTDAPALPSFVKASLPGQLAGGMIYVSDATGASLTGSMCFSNGTVWIDVTTGAAVA